jgi:hypothetical protein
MDADLVNQLNTMHARAIGASAGFQEGISNALSQLTLLISSGNANDNRLMTGFLAQTLFADNLVAQKSAFVTPFAPGAAPPTAAVPLATPSTTK